MKNLLTISVITLLVVTLSNMANAATWNVPGDFAEIQDAMDSISVLDGDTILVGPGNHYGAYVDKAVEIKGEGGAVVNDGPLHPAGLTMGFRLLAGSAGATFSHLAFTVDLAIMNGARVGDVTVDHCTFTNTVQAVSNWGGNGWQISHNVINDLKTRNGGGIGILVADWAGGIVKDNVVSHNKIAGILHVGGWYEDPDTESGGYNGSGIVVYADFRWGWPGATEISNNRIVKNSVSMVLDDPRTLPVPDENKVDIVAFELTQSYYPDDPPGYPDPLPEENVVIKNNTIGFNDWRGTVLQLNITLGLEEYNQISRNLGDNRGHGIHPKVFFE
ncbi:MAG: right-handed parallel beta-helix repeat-containing protein [Planctomycetota bacterium]